MPVRARGLPALAGRPPAAGISRRHARGVLGMTSLLTPTAPIVEGTSRRWDSIKKKRQELTPEREEEIRNVFAQLDVDKSGALSSDELQLALKEMGIYKSKEEVGLTIKEIDANDNDQVDATEFVDLVLRLERQRDVEKVFEQNDATYSIFWQLNGDVYQAVGHYGTEARKRALRSVRGDDKTFASESVKLEFSARGQAPMARAARQREEVVLDCGADGFLKGINSPQRRALAKEFGIKHIHFLPVEGGVVEYGRNGGEEVEIIKLLNALIYLILHPVGVRDCLKKVSEVGCLLLMVIKLEQADVLSGLSKAVVALYDAVMSYEKSLERDVLAAFTYAKSMEGSEKLKKDAAARGRARIIVNLIAPIFTVARAIILSIRFLRALWTMRQDAALYADKGVEKFVQKGRQASMALERTLSTTLSRVGSMKSAKVQNDDEIPLNLKPRVGTRGPAAAGPGNNDVEIFVKSTAGSR
eukprot:Tamp_14891.p1 GENE.Tamp_14891~~Tamp_14891.p1  ORF type:complete len:499 (-),score=110.50 Tamp_14891:93-1508(-)